MRRYRKCAKQLRATRRTIQTPLQPVSGEFNLYEITATFARLPSRTTIRAGTPPA